MSQLNWKRWSLQQWLTIAFTVLVALPTVAFLLVSAALLAYINWPRSYPDFAIPPLGTKTEHAVLMAHGLGDTTASWSAPLKKIMDIDNGSETTTAQVIALDWNPYSQATLRCSVDGLRIGQKIGKAWSSSKHLESAHLIGHSCGAFVILGLCKALRSARSDIRLQSTYLDPVSIYGGWSWNYGVKHFGECADFSEAYIDTEGGVPGSNELIPNTHTFDVTHVRRGSGYSGSPHVWPTFYYQLLVRSGQDPRLEKSDQLSQRYPQGKIETVENLPLSPANW